MSLEASWPSLSMAFECCLFLIVTITSVVSDTDWFNTSYEREGQGSGTIVGDTGGKLLILTERKPEQTEGQRFGQGAQGVNCLRADLLRHIDKMDVFREVGCVESRVADYVPVKIIASLVVADRNVLRAEVLLEYLLGC